MYKRIENAGGVTPENALSLGEEGLRALGVTRQKSAYLVALARQLVNGEVVLASLTKLPDDDAIAALDALHGIGPWTAHCYLLFAMRRPDAFPAADLGLLEAVRELWNLRKRPTPEALERRSAVWRPHRATAARLLWHHYLCERGRTVPV